MTLCVIVPMCGMSQLDVDVAVGPAVQVESEVAGEVESPSSRGGSLFGFK